MKDYKDIGRKIQENGYNLQKREISRRGFLIEGLLALGATALVGTTVIDLKQHKKIKDLISSIKDLAVKRNTINEVKEYLVGTRNYIPQEGDTYFDVIGNDRRKYVYLRKYDPFVLLELYRDNLNNGREMKTLTDRRDVTLKDMYKLPVWKKNKDVALER